MMGHGTDGNFPSLSSCSQLLELFPYNYAIPFYFGSLAVQSGLSHSYMYLAYDDDTNGSNVVMPWETRLSQTLDGRTVARNVSPCPEVDTMVDAVVELIHDWHSCCTRNSQQQILHDNVL